MTKKEVKYLIGIFSGIMTLMAINIPISVLGAIGESFPNASSVTIQMIVALPGFLGIVSNLIFSRMAHRVHKKSIVMLCMILFIVGGLFPFFFHSSIIYLLISACVVGFALGGIQNSSTALICDYFDGDKRAMAMGMLSVFIGLGGTIYTFVASRIGKTQWHYAYLTFLCLIPLMIIQIICMPKGILEDKPTKTNRIKVPGAVIWICIFGFFMYTVSQLFNSNISMLVLERRIGSTYESGIATTVYTVAMMFSGLVVVPFMRVCKRLSLSVLYLIGALGCGVMLLGDNLLIICVGAAILAISYGIYTPFQNQAASEASGTVGLAFNLALASAVSSLGQATSPITTGTIAGLIGTGTGVLFGIGLVITIVFTFISGVYFLKIKQ